METDVELWRAVLAAADAGTFAGAAERLHLDPSTVSRHVRRLERITGIDLFVAEGRNVALTPQALELLPAARRMVDEVARFDQQLRSIASRTARTVRFGVSGHATNAFMLTTLSEIAAEFNIELHTEEVDFHDTSGGVRSGRNHASIVWAPVEPTGLDIIPVLSVQRTVAVPERHELSERTSVKLDDLLPLPWVGPMCDDTEFVDFWLCADRRDGLPPHVGAWCRNNDDCIAATLTGRAVLVGATLRSSVRQDGLCLVPIEDLERGDVAVVVQAEADQVVRDIVTEFIDRVKTGPWAGTRATLAPSIRDQS